MKDTIRKLIHKMSQKHNIISSLYLRLNLPFFQKIVYCIYSNAYLI